MLEKEIKIMLSKEQYDNVYKLFEWNKKIEQVNYYYGDINKVKENSELTVRVRKINDDFIFQIKKPINYDKALHIKEEYEKRISEIPEVIDGEELSRIVGKKLPDFNLLGSLNTTRYVYKTDFETEICLDKSKYFDKIDYELEIEFIKQVPLEIMQLLEDNGIVPEDKTYGKFARFMKEYLNSNYNVSN